MDYQPLHLDQIETARPYFEKMRSRICDYSVGGMFMWRDIYSMTYKIENGIFYSRVRNLDGRVYNFIPMADDIPAAIAELAERELREKGESCFCAVSDEYLPFLLKVRPDALVEDYPQFDDYLYLADDLRDLKGRRFSGQRNQISQFKRSVSDWSFEVIRHEDLPELEDFFRNTYLASSNEGDFEEEENRKVLEVLQHFDTYGMPGGYLRADGKILGFSFTEKIGDMLIVHIEKADRHFKGAYQMVVNQCARTFATEEVKYINREDDSGDPGLRTSKLSYHPIEILKKYNVTLRR